MVAVRGDLYAVEPNHDEIDRISPMTAAGFPSPAELGTGMILRIDHSGRVETAMTFGPDGALYVSNLGFAGPGAGQILRVEVPN